MEIKQIGAKVLTSLEVAEALNVPYPTVYFWIRAGRLEAFQEFTGRWHVRLEDLRIFLRNYPRRAIGEERLDSWLAQQEERAG